MSSSEIGGTPVENHCHTQLGAIQIIRDTLGQCFSTFFDSRHPSMAMEQFGGTPGYNLLVNRRQVQKLAAPLELFPAPKGFAAPRLRTTEIES